MDNNQLSENTSDHYGHFLHEIKERIRNHQLLAMRAVNHELVTLYWEIGKTIQQKQTAQGWGKAVVETLAKDLQKEFPGRNGFSVQNLWLMRQLFVEYSSNEKLQPLVREISWSKNLLIMSQKKEPLEREFYLRATARYGWTKSILQHQLDGKSYEKHLLGQNSFEQTLPKGVKNQAILAVKDHYSFEFLSLGDNHSERELEQALIQNIRNFLIEMGGNFAFIGNQHKLKVGGQEYFIDLLLFHRRLRCLVAIEIKIGDFKPEHKGKMEFYLEALNTQERVEGENAPIGIIICRNKNNTVVEYALNTASRPIGVASYSILPTLPEEYRNELPSPEEIARRLQVWENGNG